MFTEIGTKRMKQVWVKHAEPKETIINSITLATPVAESTSGRVVVPDFLGIFPRFLRPFYDLRRQTEAGKDVQLLLLL